MVQQSRQLESAWSANRIVALVLGIIFTLLGIIGLFIAPTMSVGNLLGLHVDLVHNLVHLITGILGLIAAFTGWSRTYNRTFGIIYLLLGLAGLVYPGFYTNGGHNGLFLGIMHMNAVDHVFHLIVGVIASAVGFFVHDTGYDNTVPTTTPNTTGRRTTY